MTEANSRSSSVINRYRVWSVCFSADEIVSFDSAKPRRGRNSTDFFRCEASVASAQITPQHRARHERHDRPGQRAEQENAGV